jgi:hypothetical protein
MSYLAIVHDQVDGTCLWSVFEPQAKIHKNPRAPSKTAIEQQQFVQNICIQLFEAFLHDDDDGRMHFLAECLLQELGHRPIIVHGSHGGEVRVGTIAYATAEDAEARLLELWPDDVQ